jgi:class 3 adenylate cyclase
MAKELSAQWPDSQQPSDAGERFASATVLYADMRDYTAWTQRLSSSELSQVVQQFYSSVGDTVHLFGSHYMQFLGDGMLCVFVETSDTTSVNHAMRAAKAAFGLQDGTRRLDAFVKQKMGERGLPPFGLNVALHTGPVSFAKLEGIFGGGGQLTPVGETVTTALKMFQSQPAINWPIAASVQTQRLATPAARSGRRAMLNIPGRNSPLDAVELVPL